MYELQFVWPHSTLTIPSQSIAASGQKLPDSAAGQSAQHVTGDVAGESISLRLGVWFVYM